MGLQKPIHQQRRVELTVWNMLPSDSYQSLRHTQFKLVDSPKFRHQILCLYLQDISTSDPISQSQRFN